MTRNKQVIIINGSGGVGKDTFVDLARKHFSIFKFSSIDVVKRIAYEAGYKGGKTERDRLFLSDLKDLLTEYNDLPFETLKKNYDDFMNHSFYRDDEFLCLFIREPKEIWRAKDEFSATTLLITNDNVRKFRGNRADRDVEEYTYDFYIKNNGSLEELEEKAKQFFGFLREIDEFKQNDTIFKIFMDNSPFDKKKEG